MTTLRYVLSILFISLILPGTVLAEDDYMSIGMKKTIQQATHVVSLGARYHVEHSAVDSLPYDDGDMGYLLAYEYHEGIGFWQIGVEFSPGPKGDPECDYVMSPQISLILKDRIFRAGGGVFWNYMGKDPDSEWSNAYYQFIIGLGFPISGNIGLTVNSYYVFENFDTFKSFDAKDIEFGLMANYSF